MVAWICSIFSLPLDGRFLKRPGAADITGALQLDNAFGDLEEVDEAMLRLERDLSAQIANVQLKSSSPSRRSRRTADMPGSGRPGARNRPH